MPAMIDKMAHVGQMPWHGNSVCVGEKEVTAGPMFHGAGLDAWEPVRRPLYVPDEKGELWEVASHVAQVRSDDGGMLGIVSRSYEGFSNRDFRELAEAVAGGAACFNTAGSLRDGRVVWALLKVGEMSVRRLDGAEDAMQSHLLLSTSHDGSMALTAGFTSIRVVCWNTLSAALGTLKDRVSLRHTATIRERA